MEIQAIRCAIPFCAKAEEEQTKFSLIIRIATVGLGGIALLVGILALSGAPGLNTLGTTGGSVLTSGGSAILLVGLCVRCVKEGEIKENLEPVTQDNYVFVDPRARRSHSSWSSSTSSSNQTVTHSEFYHPLEKFLVSTHPNDISLRERLKKELAVEDLDLRLKENFNNDKVALALPLKYENASRNDELLFQVLKLIYLSKSDLLNLSLEEIKAYGEDQKNILSLRMLYLDARPQCIPGTFGAFRNLLKEILAADMPPALYAFFSNEQVIFFITNVKDMDAKIVEMLFPSSELQPFTTVRSTCLLSGLPLEYVNKILPYLSGRLLWPLIQSRGKELNYSSITKSQVNEMFPTSFMRKNESQQRMSLIDIEVLNQILLKMDHGHLQLIPDNHLSNRVLNLRALPQDKLRGMFPVSVMEKDKSKKRVNALASDNRTYVKTIVKF